MRKTQEKGELQLPVINFKGHMKFFIKKQILIEFENKKLVYYNPG